MDYEKGNSTRTNEKCRWSLLLPLGAWGVTAFAVAASRGDKLIAGIFGVLWILSIVAGLILAIIGLDETRHSPKGSGRGMAWSAICVVIFLFLLIGGGAVAGFRKARAKTIENFHVVGNRIVNTNLNFVMELPRAAWKQVDPKRSVKDASAVFVHENPKMLCWVIAEAATDDWTSERILDVSQGLLKSAFTKVTFTPQKRVRVGGIDGYQYEATAQYGATEIFGVHWCGAQNGYIYQLTVRGSVAPALVRQESVDLFGRFSQFNKSQRADENLAHVAPFRSRGFHYAIDLSADGWRPWVSLAKDLEGAEFGAQKRGRAYFGIIPIYLHGEDVPIETLGNALAGRFEARLTDSAMHDIKTDTNTLSFRFERGVQGKNFSYVGRVIKNGGAALFELGWWAGDAPELEEEVIRAVEKVKCDAVPAIDLLVTKSDIGKASAMLDMFVNDGQGLMYNAIALEDIRAHDWKRALFWLTHGTQMRPRDVTIAANLFFTYKRLSAPEDGLKYFESLDPSLKKLPRFQAERAWFLARTGHVDEALAGYATIFDAGFSQDEHFASYARLLADKGDIKGSLAKMEAYLKKRDSLEVRLLYAAYLSRDGRSKEAVAMLTALQTRMPADAELAFGLAEAQLSAELYSETIKTIDGLASKGINSGYTQLLKGRGQLGLKRYREARECFELAAKLDPQNSQTTAYLDLVNGLLGQGNTYSVKQPIAPVMIPEKLLAARMEPRFDANGSSAYYTTYCVALEHRNGARRKRTTVFSVKIVDASGVNLFSTLQLGLSPLSESIYLNELKVTDEKGKTIATGNPDHYYVIDATQGNMANGDRILNVPVPGLRPGATISVTMTVEDLPTAEKPAFWETVVGKTLPVSESIIYLCGDLSGMHVFVPAGMKDEVFDDGVAYRSVNPAVVRAEPMQVEFWKFVPTFALGPKEGSWKEEVTNYLAKISGKMVCDAKTRALAMEKTARAKTDLEKVRALSQVVQRQVRYVAIEFGRRGTVPATPAETLANGFGDCKDGANLLREMLAACGVDAKLALVKPLGRIYKETPSLSQFTHMIVYVPSLNAFIDPSEKSLDLTEAPPYPIVNCEALLLDPARPDFVVISPGDARNRFDIQRKISVSGTDIVVDETMKLSGWAAGAFRAALAAAPQGDRRAEFERWLARRVGAIELKDLAVADVDDVTKPLVLTSKFVVRRGGARKSPDVRAPGSWEELYLAPEPSSERKTPFSRTIPTEVACETTVEGLAGIEVSSTTPAKVSSKFGRGECAIAKDGQRLRLKTTCFVEAGEYAAEEYGEYSAAMLKMLDLFQPQIDIKGEARL